MFNYLTPNMALVIPVPTRDLGPDWAYGINASLTILDAHNHTAGAGVAIPSAALNINGDVSFHNAYNIIQARSARFFNNPTSLSAVQDIGCIYEAGGDLYYNNSIGNSVQITQGNSVAGSTGTITGLPSGTASASYQSLTGTFQFQQATATAANMDVASIAIRYTGSYPTLAGNYIALQAPSSLASAYALTLPALPLQTQVMTLDTSGVISSVSYDAVGQSMTVIGADAIGLSMGLTGANAIASTMTVVGGDAIATTMGSSGANIIAANRTRSLGVSVGIGGVAKSLPCTNFFTTSGTYVAVTPLSVTITTSGRPVLIGLISNPLSTSFIGCFGPSSASNAPAVMLVGIFNGSTKISEQQPYMFLQSGSYVSSVINLPVSSISHIDFTAAGTYTYSIQISAGFGNNVGISNAFLIAYEL